ncbi:MAG: hydroxyacid dehydrogenase [Omnitrophica bacterium RIFCSPLOWO2_12_FULL_44_17]|uniref:Hydroxyacid dehydrogenase n=1 Tax=Candidatus Danuiimicrobium aquiferis TaxID=1801832 RepID=A0A1G1KXC0_9BACT|nr:MAG: hydroxyacid dehydrogenase [Omnitrophica bacterium RIFCSPHIGHO2_02_FULL_45_28]OGW97543.1 MAG: hydroxyacid dehydrogenase [Omnitrophica bacterium RIFCSPLOWO2_12_FULL_44_17]OGX02095.1 MAG: hydroxyacid dehydrogenase [Omnitrophica bacterium RIFCSPLOWO2_02_FULL_44_11]
MPEVKIAFFDTKLYDKESFDLINKNFGFNITYFAPHLTPETVSLAKGFDVVCVFVNDMLNQDVIGQLFQNGIKLIAFRAAGYNNVDLKAALNKIHIVRVPAYSPHAVAEHAVALMMSLNRKIHKAYYRTRDNNFSIQGFLGFDMAEKTAGVIGTGKIGKVLIKILKGFEMRVLAYDLFPDEKFRSEIGFEYVGLDQIFRESDIISLHCPLSKETYHLINQGNIAKMKDGVMIINTGRGRLIDTRALIEGLKRGKIGNAGLDVYEEEGEYFFEDFSAAGIADDTLARLLTFPNVLITSHQGFFTREALHSIAETTLSNIKDYFQKGEFKNEICYKCGQQQGNCTKTKTGKCF